MTSFASDAAHDLDDPAWWDRLADQAGGGASRTHHAEGRENGIRSGPDDISAELEFPNDGAQAQAEDVEYIVKGLFGRRSHGTVIGPPGGGKTIFAIDLAFAIATGNEKYQGRRLKGGPVLYVGFEGEAGIRNRIAAAVRKHGDGGGRFARLLLPETLNKSDGERGVAQIVAACSKMAGHCAEPVALIVIDTKSLAVAGDDEDSNSDAAVYVENRIKRLMRETGAAIMTLHHPGKNIERGGRGASANKGADDFTIIMKREGANRVVHIDKCRDGPDAIDWFTFGVEVVELRTDADGDAVTAVRLAGTESAVPTSSKPRRKLTTAAKRALRVLEEEYTNDRALAVPAARLNLDGLAHGKVPLVVEIDALKTACAAARLSAEGKANAERMAFERAISALEDAGLIARYGEYLWLVGQPERASPDARP